MAKESMRIQRGILATGIRHRKAPVDPVPGKHAEVILAPYRKFKRRGVHQAKARQGIWMTRGFFELPAQDSTFRGHEGREDFFLVPEMEVKGRRGDTDPRGEFSHGKARQPLVVEEASGMFQDCLTHGGPSVEPGTDLTVLRLSPVRTEKVNHHRQIFHNVETAHWQPFTAGPEFHKMFPAPSTITRLPLVESSSAAAPRLNVRVDQIDELALLYSTRFPSL